MKIAISNVVTDLDLSSISSDGIKVQVLRIPISNVVIDLDLSSISSDGIKVQVLRIPISNVVMDEELSSTSSGGGRCCVGSVSTISRFEVEWCTFNLHSW